MQLQQRQPSQDTRQDSPQGRLLSIVLVALPAVCAFAVGVAALRHTGSLAFPIDDAYIYSNYVAAAAQGQPFTYNPGERSGGVTGIGWYALCVLSYALLAPFHALLGGLAPSLVVGNPTLATQAGHLYLSAYMAGVACLAATALGVRRLAELALTPSPRNPRARRLFCAMLGAVAAGGWGLLWGAMSGLEVTLASALAVWAACTLLADAREGRLRWSLLLVALLPLARPDLIVIGLAGTLWLLLRAWWLPAAEGKRVALLNAALYVLAAGAGVGVMALAYWWGWGRPLPSSFYAKVGGLRLGDKFFGAAQELVLAGRTLPFVVGVAALVGGIMSILGKPDKGNAQAQELRFTAILPSLASLGYIVAIMASLPWFGQEDRYLLPVHPFIIVLVGMLVWRLLQLFPLDAALSRWHYADAFVMGALALLLVGGGYLWATRNYAVHVRNIADAHIAPALWLAEYTPPDALVAAEPIGAVRLFSGRRTIDLVGLTTPSTLGTYGDWPVAWLALRSAGASYLLFYPDWFDKPGPPPWTALRARFAIPDNRIAGDDVIAIYELDWSLYQP